jgi:dihydroorotate dehydrogenase
MKHDLSVFGPVWDGAGARGMSGEGYWFHRLFPATGAAMRRSTFVAKTVTRRPHRGNMALTRDYRPARWFPDCVRTNFHKAAAVNAVGLANPGVEAFLATDRWQRLTDPFMLSFMPVGPEESHETQTWEFAHLLEGERNDFRSEHIGLQLNLSCPNVKADLSGIVRKAEKLLPHLAVLGMPVIVKLNLLVPPAAAAELAKHPDCAGICVANTIPYGELPFDIQWDELFGETSPLPEGYGGGGLSGAPLLPLVEDWVRKFRQLDGTTHVNAGGGIMQADDVRRLFVAGASSVFFATALMLRPWRVPGIVRTAYEMNQLFG